MMIIIKVIIIYIIYIIMLDLSVHVDRSIHTILFFIIVAVGSKKSELL